MNIRPFESIEEYLEYLEKKVLCYLKKKLNTIGCSILMGTADKMKEACIKMCNNSFTEQHPGNQDKKELEKWWRKFYQSGTTLSHFVEYYREVANQEPCADLWGNFNEKVKMNYNIIKDVGKACTFPGNRAGIIIERDDEVYMDERIIWRFYFWIV